MTQAEEGMAVLARRVRDLRTAAGMTQTELGDRMTELGLKWGRTTVAKLESGNRVSFNSEELLALARVFDVPPIWLLTDLKKGTALRLPGDLEVDPWSAALWMVGKRHLDPSMPTSGSWAEAEELLGHLYQVASILDQYQAVAQHRERVELMSPNGEPDEAEQAHRERQDRSILGKLRDPLSNLARRGAWLPPLPADVMQRARELGIDVSGQEAHGS